jgi:carbamoyltransferase
MSRLYIGLANTLHDTAMAVVNPRGEILFAEATERPMQNKRAINIMPDLVMRAGRIVASLSEPVEEVVMAFSWSDGAQRKLALENTTIPSDDALKRMEALAGRTVPLTRRAMARLRWLASSQGKALSNPGDTLEYELRCLKGWESARIVRRFYDHHLTHAATACFTSPFEDAACAVVDAVGEGGAHAFYKYRDGQLARVNVPASKGSAGSLGAFYSEICEACGFDSIAGEEWKVMGLASYGEPDPELCGLLRDMIRVDGLQIIAPSGPRAFFLHKRLDAIARRAGEPSLAAANLAYAGQTVFAEAVFLLLNNLNAHAEFSNLAFGGGCALNSSVNGSILRKTPFRHLYVFSAPADDGNAIGAAFMALKEDIPDYRPAARVMSPYLGSKMSAQSLQNLARHGGFAKLDPNCADPPRRAAELLADGKIVGWIQGRAEFGPRALGNRSILADPRSSQVKDALNSRVKFREEFRPFAPSILHDFGPQYFEDYQESPYMERTLQFRREVMPSVPAVVHHDGTGRLQTVKREWNERYFRLINSFRELTGIPLVLNTSFNVMGKPIAHSVEDAVAVFCTSGLDALFIDDLLVEK